MTDNLTNREKIARALHDNFCNRAKKRVTHNPDDKSCYSNNAWDELPPSMKNEYLDEADTLSGLLVTDVDAVMKEALIPFGRKAEIDDFVANALGQELRADNEVVIPMGRHIAPITQGDFRRARNAIPGPLI